MSNLSILERCLLCLFCLTFSFNTSQAQNITIPEMKRMATLEFSNIETIALNKGYNYERNYTDPSYPNPPTQSFISEFPSLDGSSNLVSIRTIYNLKIFDKNGKNINGKPHVSYAIELHFNDPNLRETYKSHLETNNYKKGMDMPIFDQVTTIYESTSQDKHEVKLVRFDKNVKFRYRIRVTVNPLPIKVQ